MTSESLVEYLYEALNSPLGVIVRVEDPNLLRQKLYPLRKQDPDLHCLHFVLSPTAPNTDLWIVRQPEEVIDAKE